MDDVLKNFAMFGFNMRPGIEWGDMDHGSSKYIFYLLKWISRNFSNLLIFLPFFFLVLPFNSTEEAPQNKSSLRDTYLKPGFSHSDFNKKDSDLDGKVDVNAVKSLLGDQSSNDQNINPVVQYSQPKIFSSQVFVRTIRRPDGVSSVISKAKLELRNNFFQTVETIRKVRDHTGKEETTITTDYVDPNSPTKPSVGDDDAGTLIFKRFFPF